MGIHIPYIYNYNDILYFQWGALRNDSMVVPKKKTLGGKSHDFHDPPGFKGCQQGHQDHQGAGRLGGVVHSGHQGVGNSVIFCPEKIRGSVGYGVKLMLNPQAMVVTQVGQYGWSIGYSSLGLPPLDKTVRSATCCLNAMRQKGG